MRFLVLATTLAAIGLVWLAARRSHRELVGWRGTDGHRQRRVLRATAFACAIALTAIALLRAADRPPDLSNATRDVVLVLDTSRSMGVTDVAPSRLRRAVRTASELVLEVESARFGLVLFAGDGFAALPLSHDQDAVLTYLSAVDTDVVSHRGSDLSRALNAAIGVFDPRSRRGRSIVLLSDGEHAGSSLGPALARARAEGVRITSVGFGELRGGAVPGPGGRALRTPDAQEVVSRRSDATLSEIASETGGAFHVEHRDRPDAADLLPAASAGVEETTRISPELRGALGLVFALLLFELVVSTGTALPRPALRLATARAAAALIAALCFLGVAGSGWLREGDAALAEGDAGKALRLYRRVERTHGVSPESRLRIGNGLYKEDKADRAAAAYLDALRSLPREADEERFVANFNLGDALLVSERYAEARDAFWTAILERPDSIEAKFNYEYALERAPPEEPSTDPTGASSDTARSELSEGDGDTPLEQLVPARADRRAAPSLTEAEAESWLASLDERVDAPLKRQIADQMDPAVQPEPGGQRW